LIFGLLALQMDFLSSEQLLDAMHAWMRRKDTPLGEILRERGLLADRRVGLLDEMVAEHVAQHGGDVQASLAALRVEQSLRHGLDRLDDDDVQASVASLAPTPADIPRQNASEDSVAWPATAAPLSATVDGGRFRRLREHARGGLGEVFVALDAELNREVALKEIQDRFADQAESRARFVREAEITGNLEHPGVVPVYGLGAYADGRPYYAMRFIRGESMQEAIARFHEGDADPWRDPGERSLALRELLTRFVAVCNAVGYAHARGVIHRDLKPANVMLGEYAETLVVDWGLARMLDRADGEQTTAERPVPGGAGSGTAATEMGQVVGTPAYMPPEQAAGRHDQLGTASDVFALGATLYCLLTGTAPYSGPDVLAQAARVEFVPVGQRQASLPAALAAVCGKAMAARPQERYATARVLAEEVGRFLADEPVQAYPEPLGDRLRRWGRRHRSVVSAAVVLLAASVLGLSVGLWAVNREKENTQAALGRALAAEQEAKASAALAEAQKEKAEKAEAATLADYRASTDDAIEELISSKPVLGPQEKRYLEKTLKRWQAFAARIGDDERSRFIRAEGHFRVAYLRAKLGQAEEAATGFREALALYQKLAEEYPASRQHLASSHHNLGNLLRSQNQGEKAAVQYGQALAIQQKLAEQYPAVPEHRQELARSHNNLGYLLAGQNQGEKAAVQYGQALAIQQKLAEEYRAVPEYRQDLATSHNNLGNLLKDQNQGEKAAAQYGKALLIQQQLTDEYPAVPAYRQHLARSHHNLGILLAGQNQPEKAAAQYGKALLIQQQLTDEYPAVPAYRQELARSHNNLGILLAGQNQGEKAAEQYGKALLIQQRLTDEYRAVPAYRQELASSHYNLGLLLAGQSQLEKAAVQYGKALAIRQKLAEQYPAVPAYRQELAGSHNDLGILLKDQNQPDKAAEHFGAALLIQQQLTDEFPAVPTYRQDLARSHNNLGLLLAGQNQPEKAAQQYGKALLIQQQLTDEYPAVPAYRQELARSHHNLGILLAGQNQPEKAAQQYGKALAIRQKLAEQYPAVPAYQVELGGGCGNYGNLLSAGGKLAESLPWYDRAIRTLTAVHRQDARLVTARLFLRNSHGGRAVAYDGLKRHAEAVRDWSRVIELSPPREQTKFRVHRAASRIGAGQVAEAVAEVAELTKAGTWDAGQWYDFACIYALAAGGQDGGKKKEYADRAMELLQRAVKAGYRDAVHMGKDRDLDVLRGREDFKKLMESLAKTKEKKQRDGEAKQK
jgi:serine/threonine-protein kinase